MEFVKLGNSGLDVSKIILGMMTYGSKSWREWVLEDEEEVFKLLKYAYDVGIRTWDTADAYSNGESERLIGKFLKKYNIPRSSIVIFSKVFFYIEDDERLKDDKFSTVNRSGLSRKRILDAVDASVERLGTYIDLYQIHRFDPTVPKAEIMEALHDVVKSGKARYIGASSMRAVEFAQLQFTAEKNGWTKFVSMQNYYNLLYREEEREMIPFCNETGVAIVPWSPIGRGALARPVGAVDSSLRSKTDTLLASAKGANAFGMKIGSEQASPAIIGRVEEVAKARGVSMAVVATAWTLAKNTTPIVGINKIERIDEAVQAVSFKLTDDEIKYLEEPYVAQATQGFVASTRI